MLTNNEIETLFKTHYAQMHRIAEIILHDVDMAHDIVHDVFSAIMDNPPTRKVDGGYLVSSVRNRCLNHIRNIGNRDRIHALYLLEMERYDDDDWSDTDSCVALSRIIDETLPEQNRKVVKLYYGDGLKMAEIAMRLNISISAVHKSLNRSLNIIRKKLEGNG